MGRREHDAAIGDVMLQVERITAAGDRGGDALKDVTLSVRTGEILGIAGVAGNGQRELAEAVTGMRPLTAGTVSVGGMALSTGDPRAAIRRPPTCQRIGCTPAWRRVSASRPTSR